MLVRTRYETGQCGVYLEQCRNKVVRTVWEGDQLLLELRSTGEYNLESDAEWVAYSHGPGIDAPLAVRVRSDRVGAAARNWRGLYDAGVFPNGSTYVEGLNLKEIEWAGRNYRAFFDYVHDPAAPEPVWLGSLLTHKRDASGQLYMRNRYFDPTSGRFTQEDPIGIAGGLNLYAFGGGDPVSYSDPYGLSAQTCPPAPCPPVGLGVGTTLRGAAASGPAFLLTLAVGIATAIGNKLEQNYEDNYQRELYHRRESPTQTVEHARMQEESGELWGGGGRAAVREDSRRASF